MSRRAVLAAAAVAVAAVLVAGLFVAGVLASRRPAAFDFKPDEPFRLELGRGGGRDGLETVATDQTGRAVLHRLQSERRGGSIRLYCETAELELDAEALRRITDAVRDTGLLRMRRAYHKDVADGTQWIFRLRQGENEKAIYFNNRFPGNTRRFAAILDGVLDESGREDLSWSRVADDKMRDHEKALWESIRDGP